MPIIELLRTRDLCDPDTLVGDLVDSDGNWNLPASFRTAFPQLCSGIEKVAILMDRPDERVWPHSASGAIQCRDIYLHLSTTAAPPMWVRYVWKTFIPPARSIFAWRLLQGRIPTDDVLIRRGFSMASKCRICGNDLETISHLFLTCPYAAAIWDCLGVTFRIRLDASGSMVSMFEKAIKASLRTQVFNLWTTTIGLCPSIRQDLGWLCIRKLEFRRPGLHRIDDFLLDGQLYRFEYGVSPFVLLIKRAGTCSLAYSNPPEQVLARASYLLNHGFGNYHLLGKNCEDFALYCKTGILQGDRYAIGRSGQIKSLVAAIFAVTTISHRLLLTSTLIGLPVLVVFGLYCFFRLSYEFKFQRQSGVAVEKLRYMDNVQEKIMMEKTNRGPRWYLSFKQYLGYIIAAISIWYWIPDISILKSVLYYVLLDTFVYDHLALHGLEDFSFYTIWLLGYWSDREALKYVASFSFSDKVCYLASEYQNKFCGRSMDGGGNLLMRLECLKQKLIVETLYKLTGGLLSVRDRYTSLQTTMK
ncbi:hypothetical protein FNV43_RR04316 [Rhamnella rubrinervis]|uniref:Reverse transcriptase zinc-binding domain-containing protein n=1 Tax=Rhamnella rubrinervis TaxID=2594499 RepID=A0A8K0MQH0_9ROSA|nr:hypothetical protein FNV43_RR04316 [Rhamnella rubrinervis]